MSNWREFRREGRGKNSDLVWMVRQDGEIYYTRSGIVGGKLQEFSDNPGDKGKPGTKAYQSAVDNCKFHISREVRKKEEKGYSEFIDGKLVTKVATSITSFGEPLPKNFCPCKPNSKISDSAHEKIFKSGKARYSRKRDGFCSIFVKHSYGWECYSRRIDINTDWFPNHIDLLEQSANEFDVGTIIVGEMVCIRNDGSDNYKATSRVCRSDADVARKLIEDKECPEPTFFIFDILYHNSKSLHEKTYDERAKLWKNIGWKNNLIQPVSFHDVTIDNWMKFATDNKWEGFVITDGNCIPGDKFYSFDGEAKRPNGHHKLKVTKTEDVVVFAVSEGSGKRMGLVGAIFVKQINPDTGEFFNCGKIGSGFSDETTEEMTKLCKEKGILFLKKDTEALKIDLQDKNHDIVVEMEYSERQEDTNKFKFPVFLRIRNDKGPQECTAEI